MTISLWTCNFKNPSVLVKTGLLLALLIQPKFSRGQELRQWLHFVSPRENKEPGSILDNLKTGFSLGYIHFSIREKQEPKVASAYMKIGDGYFREKTQPVKSYDTIKEQPSLFAIFQCPVSFNLSSVFYIFLTPGAGVKLNSQVYSPSAIEINFCRFEFSYPPAASRIDLNARAGSGAGFGIRLGDNSDLQLSSEQSVSYNLIKNPVMEQFFAIHLMVKLK